MIYKAFYFSPPIIKQKLLKKKKSSNRVMPMDYNQPVESQRSSKKWIILILVLIILIVSIFTFYLLSKGSSEKTDIKEKELTTEKFSFIIDLPEEIDIQLKDLIAVSSFARGISYAGQDPYKQKKVSFLGGFSLDSPDLDAYNQIITIQDQDQNTILMGYTFPRSNIATADLTQEQKSIIEPYLYPNQNPIKIDSKSTAFALVMLEPSLVWISPQQQLLTAVDILGRDDFNSFVNEIKEELIKNPTGYLAKDSNVYEITKAIFYKMLEENTAKQPLDLDFDRGEIKLSNYPNFFINEKEKLFNAKLVTPSSSIGIISAGEFAAELEILKYKKGIGYIPPILLTSTETKNFNSNIKGRFIKNTIRDGDLIMIGDPCDEEMEIMREKYISCEEWRSKPYSYEVSIQEEGNSIKMYALLKDEVKEKDSIWRFLRGYITLMSKPIPSETKKICFSETQERVDC